MIIRIGIVDRDEEYVSRLADVLQDYDGVELYTFTDATSLESNLDNAKLDVVLFSDDMYYAGMEKQSRLSIVLLEETGETRSELADYAKVQKYQRISNIYKYIIEQYASIAGITSDGTVRATKIITFWSPIGGVGKTTVAMAAANKLAMDGKRVFYINFENYPSDDVYLEDKLGKGIRDLAVDLNKDINFELKIRGILQEKRPNFYYMNHFDRVIDFEDTSDDELQRLVEIIVDYGNFDYVIVDIDSSVNSKNKRILKMADRVMIVSSQDSFALKKLAALYEELSNKEENADKYYVVRNKMQANQVRAVAKEPTCIACLPCVNAGADLVIEKLANDTEMAKIVGVL